MIYGGSMENLKYFSYIVDEIHTVIVGTVDENGLPITCAIDIMDYDDNSLYFLTAKGKSFFERLKNKKYLSFTGMKGDDTLSRVAVSVSGEVREIGSEKLQELFTKNPYMYEIYKTEESRSALTVFQIYNGSGEWFDLSKKPIERAIFNFGDSKELGIDKGYFISEKCIGCGMCLNKCPQSCINSEHNPFVIKQKNCLHCGNCFNICPMKAIVKR